jgi:hypothetical protein
MRTSAAPTACRGTLYFTVALLILVLLGALLAIHWLLPTLLSDLGEVLGTADKFGKLDAFGWLANVYRLIQGMFVLS